jgi:hypothetical protein
MDREGFRLASVYPADLDEAEREGWLGPTASAAGVRATVSAARSALEEGNVSAARERIGQLLDELGAGRHADLLSEGRALLEYRLPLLREGIR